jgi:hypothetical protein
MIIEQTAQFIALMRTVVPMDSCNFKSCSTSRIPLIIVQNYTEQSVNHDEEPELHHRGVDNVQKQKSEKEGNWSSDKRQIWRRSLMGPVFVR